MILRPGDIDHPVFNDACSRIERSFDAELEAEGGIGDFDYQTKVGGLWIAAFDFAGVAGRGR